jgi:hypothetical protein
MMPRTKISLSPAILLVCTAAVLNAASIPEQDSRNVILPDGNTHFQMPVFTSREAWEARASDLRKQILASAGLLPLPAKTPLHPQVFGKLEREGYSVEKVLLETYPGFYLGGNLYRPLGKSGPFPAVVSPHGHWDYGRLENTSVVSIPARGINLARQGFVVFTYDMVGYNDTSQFPHGDKGPRLGGDREDLWNISTMGLQLWNSIRAVDFRRLTTGCRSGPPCRHWRFRRRHADVPVDRRGRPHQSLRACEYDFVHPPGWRLPGGS